jgi:replicative DNA helicase
LAGTTGIELLSVLRKTGSSSLLREVPETFFLENDEKRAFQWLVDYVQEHQSFPQASTFKRETDITLVKTREPVDYYVDRARKRALFYAISNKLSELQEAVADKDPDLAADLAQEITLIRNNLSTQSTGVTTLQSAMAGVFDDHNIAKWQPLLRGIPSGWGAVDAVTNGWQNGDLITFVGRPGLGKTYMLLKNAHSAWQAGKSVLFVSMEMTTTQIARRFLGLNSGINPDIIRKGLSSDVEAQLKLSCNETMSSRGVPFHLIAGNFKKSVDAVQAAAHELRPDIILVDASYLLSPAKKRQGSSGRRESVSDVIEELGSLAKSLDRPILNTVQFNRQAVRGPAVASSGGAGRSNPLAHLGLHKIGETDVVGQVSSIVMGIELYEPPNEFSKRYLGVLKGREGEFGHWVINYRFSPTVDFSICVDNDEYSPVAEINLDYAG